MNLFTFYFFTPPCCFYASWQRCGNAASVFPNRFSRQGNMLLNPSITELIVKKIYCLYANCKHDNALEAVTPMLACSNYSLWIRDYWKVLSRRTLYYTIKTTGRRTKTPLKLKSEFWHFLKQRPTTANFYFSFHKGLDEASPERSVIVAGNLSGLWRPGGPTYAEVSIASSPVSNL